jgi:transglutaminase-like putative cysteine protease
MYSTATTQPGTYVDSDHPAIIEFTGQHASGSTDVDRAVSLYYAVRDGFRYDPYRLDLSPDGMKASTVIATGHGWCVTKAALLAAAWRAAGLPARVGFADVRNHLTTERLRRSMGTDIFIWHGFAEIWLDGAWRKATPAFNLQLCEKFGLLPLEFNGRDDSLYHPFDTQGQRHMEYIAQRGSFDDVPVAQIAVDLAAFYSSWLSQRESLADNDFLADAASA